MAAIDERIEHVERHFGVQLPEDYRLFLKSRNSMSRFVPPTDDYLMLDPADELIGINEAGEFQERFPGSLVIGGDGARELLTYDFRQSPPPLVLLDTAASDWSAAIPQAPSLTVFLDQFPESGWIWGDED
ncbi:MULTISPECIES: SMI1/KNR4 family protein [unclassified Streptomyces]|uniref:SMI1/KNR4 family protein n=1 Tax=unclassified Streptomyces TaxID=2593676 RepID=UPI003401BF80